MDRYREFHLELLDYRADAAQESFRARVIESPAGALPTDESQRTPIPSELRRQLVRLEREKLDGAGLQSLGIQLGDLLFTAELRALLQRSLDKLAADEGLRIRLRFDAQQLGYLPWEYAYLPLPGTKQGDAGSAGFLALDPRISIVRQEVAPDTTARISTKDTGEIRFAALLASPTHSELGVLDLDKEAEVLESALEDIAEVETQVFQPGTVAQLEQALTNRPQVFHYAGHGDYGRSADGTESQGMLLLAAEDGSGKHFSIDKFGQNLRSHNVRLVVLSACETAQRDTANPWTAMAPALIRHGIPAVVGMQYKIRDDNAIAFARAFYRALARGRSIDEAMSDGRLAIFNRADADDRDWGVPALYLQGRESVLFPPPPGPYRRNTFMLFAIVALLTIWYTFHIEPAATRLMTLWAGKAGIGIGALLALLGMWKVAGSWLSPTDSSDRKQSWLERLLRRPRAGMVLAVTLLGSVFLLSTTRSLYLSNSDDSAHVEVRALVVTGAESDEPHTLRVAAGEPVAGGPTFLHFPPDKTVSLEAVQPAGFVVREPTQKWRAWRRLSLQYPEDFLSKDVRLVRVIAGNALLSSIPAPDQDDAIRTYSLRGRIGTQAFGPIDFRHGLVYIGADKAVAQARIAAESGATLGASLKSCLPRGSDLDDFTPYFDASTTFVETEIGPQDTLEIEVVDNATNDVISTKVTISATAFSTDAVNPVCLSKQ